MDWQVGDILEGKVSGITKFGAFVALPGGKSGLVHISEVANAFVSNVGDHVQLGQTVKVMLLSVTPEGKINLSIIILGNSIFFRSFKTLVIIIKSSHILLCFLFAFFCKSLVLFDDFLG